MHTIDIVILSDSYTILPALTLTHLSITRLVRRREPSQLGRSRVSPHRAQARVVLPPSRARASAGGATRHTHSQVRKIGRI